MRGQRITAAVLRLQIRDWTQAKLNCREDGQLQQRLPGWMDFRLREKPRTQVLFTSLLIQPQHQLLPSLSPCGLSCQHPSRGRESQRQRDTQTNRVRHSEWIWLLTRPPNRRQNYFPETFSKPFLVSHWQNQVMCIPEPVSSRMNGIVLQCLRVTL